MSKRTITAREAKRKKENTIKIVIILVVLTLFTACSTYIVLNDENPVKDNNEINLTNNGANTNKEQKGEDGMVKGNDKYKNVDKNPVVTMEMTDGKIVKIELYPQIAPTTVENFISLIKEGFYDGLTFHRVMPEFMAQGGDPKGNGTGGPDYSIKGEFSSNGFENNLKHEVGVISMARSNDMDSAGSQFFIVTNENSYQSLDGLYAGFGKVIEGYENVQEIVNTKTKRSEYSEELMNEIMASGGQITTEEQYIKYMEETTEMTTPVVAPTIKTMTVDTFGFDYDEPERL